MLPVSASELSDLLEHLPQSILKKKGFETALGDILGWLKYGLDYYMNSGTPLSATRHENRLTKWQLVKRPRSPECHQSLAVAPFS